MSEKEQPNPDFEALLEFIRTDRGFDFTGYKRPSLARRIGKRMEAAGVEGFANYQAYLQATPTEFVDLFNTILINVTAFFRDEVAWDFLREEIVPRLLQAREKERIRVWSTGCASGEEAYSLAMVLAEAMGEENFKRRVKIYATDVDDDALNVGRHAVYTSGQVEPVHEALRERYFESSNGNFAFRKDMRRSVIFGRHDLLQDPPISKIDLLVSRNTLMYFDTQTQVHVLNNFHFALRDDGFLFLGKSEALAASMTLFSAIVVTLREVEWRVGDEVRYVDLQIAPLVSRTGEGLGIGVTFTEVTRFRRLQEALQESKREMETAYEELQSTVEELETTNEELQSTNEELETTNEELQSTNEELETMNEELQSTNEELETMNDELRERTDETLQANSFLGSVLSGIRQGVIVVDRTLRVVAWSRRATDLWGLRDVEVEGEHLLNLDIGLPVQRLRDPIRRVVAGSGVPDLELEGHDRRGKPVRVKIAFAPLQNRPDAEEPDGALLLVSAERDG